jgi:hypothetical protein
MATKRSSPIWEINQKDLEELVARSNSYKQVLNFFGLENKGNNFKTLRKCMDEMRIDYSHFQKASAYLKAFNVAQPISNILIENSGYCRTHLKARLLKERLLDNVCYICGQLPEWNGKPLSLHLDHINGISNDNRIENLRILCPHCHSQTDNFAGKNKKVVIS